MLSTPSMIIEKHPDEPKEAAGLRALGYWKWNPQKDNDWVQRIAAGYEHLPDPRDFVDPAWDPKTRAVVVDYLKSGSQLVQWRGWSNCRLCNVGNGSTCLSDGTFVWPEGFAHYVEVHGVRPPEEFARHVTGKL